MGFDPQLTAYLTAGGRYYLRLEASDPTDPSQAGRYVLDLLCYPGPPPCPGADVKFDEGLAAGDWVDNENL